MSASVILVADRDPLQRQLIDLLLAEDRYVIVGVESGKQALEYVRENTPDMAILDLDLDDYSGADVCEKMKSVTRLHTVPVILTTPNRGSGGLDARTKSLAHFVGTDLVLQKPLGDKSLRQRVAELLAGGIRRPGSGSASLQSTLVIEEALESIAPPEPAMAATAREVDLERERHTLEIETLQTKIDLLEAELMRLTDDGSVGRGSRIPRKVQNELDELRERVEDQQRTIDELRRRNDLLVQAIEQEKRKSAQRGLFGRRRGA